MLDRKPYSAPPFLSGSSLAKLWGSAIIRGSQSQREQNHLPRNEFACELKPVARDGRGCTRASQDGSCVTWVPCPRSDVEKASSPPADGRRRDRSPKDAGHGGAGGSREELGERSRVKREDLLLGAERESQWG